MILHFKYEKVYLKRNEVYNFVIKTTKLVCFFKKNHTQKTVIFKCLKSSISFSVLVLADPLQWFYTNRLNTEKSKAYCYQCFLSCLMHVLLHRLSFHLPPSPICHPIALLICPFNMTTSLLLIQRTEVKQPTPPLPVCFCLSRWEKKSTDFSFCQKSSLFPVA